MYFEIASGQARRLYRVRRPELLSAMGKLLKCVCDNLFELGSPFGIGPRPSVGATKLMNPDTARRRYDF
jgi:hypothetical protein